MKFLPSIEDWRPVYGVWPGEIFRHFEPEGRSLGSEGLQARSGWMFCLIPLKEPENFIA